MTTTNTLTMLRSHEETCVVKRELKEIDSLFFGDIGTANNAPSGNLGLHTGFRPRDAQYPVFKHKLFIFYTEAATDSRRI